MREEKETKGQAVRIRLAELGIGGRDTEDAVEWTRNTSEEKWLRDEVAPAYDALKADPSRAVSAARVRATLAAEHKKATAKR
jgi:hypothetical protein